MFFSEQLYFSRKVCISPEYRFRSVPLIFPKLVSVVQVIFNAIWCRAEDDFPLEVCVPVCLVSVCEFLEWELRGNIE